MKFTSIILALLLAPSVAVADLPANENGSGSDAAAVGVGVGRRLGGKSAKSGSNGSAIKLSEEEAEANSNTTEAEVSAMKMKMGAGGKKKSCAASRPAVAIEQVAIAIFLVEMDLVKLKGSFPPSIATFIESNYDPSIDPDIDENDLGVIFLINRVLSEMSCEEYIEGQEASVLMKLILSTGKVPSTDGPMMFSPWLKLKDELSGSAAFGEIVANLGN